MTILSHVYPNFSTLPQPLTTLLNPQTSAQRSKLFKELTQHFEDFCKSSSKQFNISPSMTEQDLAIFQIESNHHQTTKASTWQESRSLPFIYYSFGLLRTLIECTEQKKEFSDQERLFCTINILDQFARPLIISSDLKIALLRSSPSLISYTRKLAKTSPPSANNNPLVQSIPNAVQDGALLFALHETDLEERNIGPLAYDVFRMSNPFEQPRHLFHNSPAWHALHQPNLSRAQSYSCQIDSLLITPALELFQTAALGQLQFTPPKKSLKIGCCAIS